MTATQPLPKKDATDLLQFGTDLMTQAQKIILTIWGDRALNTVIKTDLSPVTEADIKAEEFIRTSIHKRYPSHGIIGEEFGNENPTSEFQWTIDPIDGTENLVHGIPTFGSMLGLRFHDQAVLGWIFHPALNVSTFGGGGLGVFHNGTTKSTGYFLNNNEAPSPLLAISTPKTFARSEEQELFSKLSLEFKGIRVYYDCYGHTLALTQSVGATIEWNLKTWDLTPAEAMIKEAGGSFYYLHSPKTNNLPTNKNAIFGQKKRVEELVSFLSQSSISITPDKQ